MAEITYREAVKQALREEMARDERVFLVGEDIGRFGGTFKVSVGLLDEFGPMRVRNTPISEAAIMGLAVGAAATGLRPIAEIMYCDFVTIAMDQLVNQAAKMRYMYGARLSMPLTVRIPMGGRRSAAAQHSQCLEAWLAHVPGLKVALPSNAYDAKGLLKWAVRDPNPTILFENKMLYNTPGEVPDDLYLVAWGKANTLRQGSDVTVVATSDMVAYSLKAATELESEGISVEVIDPRTLVPLDIETMVESVKRTQRLVIAHEACVTGGFGGEIAAQVGYDAFEYLDAPIERVGAMNTPIPFAPILEKHVLPDDSDVVEAVRRTLS